MKDDDFDYIPENKNDINGFDDKNAYYKLMELKTKI